MSKTCKIYREQNCVCACVCVRARENLVSKPEGTRHLVRRRLRWQEKVKGLLGRGSSVPGGKAAGT